MRGAVCLVPARGGSKRVVGKNGREIGGVRLFEWSLEIGKEMGVSYLSTEVEEWGRRAEEIGCGWIRRAEELVGDGVGDYEVVRHALGEMGEVDLLVYLRPTTPFRDPAVVRQAIEVMKSEPYTSLRSVEVMGESAFKCFMRSTGGMLMPIRRGGVDMTDKPNQEVPVTYRANGYVDIIRPKLMFHYIRDMWGSDKYGFITPRAVEIDTEEDLEYARWYYERR